MRLLLIDKTAVLESNHERFERIAALSGDEVSVLSPVWWHEHGRDVRAQRVSHPGYRIILGRTFWTGSYSRGFYLSGLGHALKSFRPDVIQLLEEPWSFFAGQTCALARRYCPKANILFYTWENIYREKTYCSKLDAIHRRIEPYVFERSMAGVCATETALNVLRRKGFQKAARVIPYGIAARFFITREALDIRRQALKADRLRVGYIGRLLPMKGVETLLGAMAMDNFHLTILGSGPDEARLRQLAQARGLDARIDWIPAVAPEKVPEILAGLDVLALPSRTTPVWAEQLGRVLLEAMASGVVVVGSSSGCIPDVIHGHGWIFKEGNPESLAECLREIRNNPEKRSQNLLNAWEWVKTTYTWEAFAVELIKMFRGVGK